jgi:glutamine synthetase
LFLFVQRKIAQWLRARRVTEVEVLIPDFTGIPRGKIIPAEKFLLDAVRLPESVLGQSVTGEWGLQEEFIDRTDVDMELRADPAACYPVPWAHADEPTAQIICDCLNRGGRLIPYAPRAVLKRVLRLFAREGWRPLVAPEIEFYFAARDNNPDNPLRPPAGRTGRPEFGRQPYSIDAVNEFELIIDDIYRFAEAEELAVDTLSHEEGAAQFEINFKHGEPLAMADQVMMFKRCVREAAIKQSMTATFMAKPVETEPGSAMHLHQSVEDRDGVNLFSGGGANSKFFNHYIGGLQKYLPEAAAIYLPNVNSYRRISAPQSTANAHWGIDNRTVGFRVPGMERPKARRVENRICGADANPYLAIAASLLCGYLGVVGKIPPKEMTRGSPWDLPRGLPLTFEDALSSLSRSKALRERLGNRFVNLYVGVKRTELKNYQRIVSSWERKFLLLSV